MAAERFNYYGSITGGNAPTSVASDTSTLLPWGPASAIAYPGQGPQPFDLTIPTIPVILAAGNYSFSCEGQIAGAHPGKTLSVLLEIDTDGIDDGPGTKLSMEGAATLANVGCRRFLAAGTKIDLSVFHNIGAPADVDNWIQVSWLATA